ncbi:PhzF family phenazine biosynthesis protein [Antrihabitans cavernicola]|uniref:PhzF family phenazine biosynthesis protein n=1 Tax=Antrihabitans cavernicola TaxID=2495913 RepID=A0A5A7SDU6_9NOCA|nr:PhzF family phenazine biosynthesis protein [Spelaeibacter cavernicola]KAA0023362.1 PhzF family phenazine biosynthesis protein [Spelaeibacter cavernicola]
MSIDVAVVRVFTDAAGEFGNELGIVDAAAVPESDRQALTAQLGFSETIFVGPVVDGTAPAQIFTPAVELPFAGHPTVGLAWWLADRGTPADTLAVPAGAVLVTTVDGVTFARGRADWSPHFDFHDLPDADAVNALDPASFHEGHHYAWAWLDESAGSIRSRMFAPAMGVAEDEATGSAAVRITDRLQRSLTVHQGQGSTITTQYNADGWIHVGGRVVPDRRFVVDF